MATFLGVYTFTLLQHISQRLSNDNCIILRQPTLSQRRSVTLSANNLVIHNVVATFLGVYKYSLPQHCLNIFQNVVATFSKRSSHNVELLAGRVNDDNGNIAIIEINKDMNRK